MSALDDLKEYCFALQEKRAIEQQIERIGGTGAPAGLRPLGGADPRTNDSAAAARQQQDGLEAMLRRKKAELEDKALKGERALDRIEYARARVIMRQFYVLRKSDAWIADDLRISKKTVQRIRAATERELEGIESA